MKNHPPSPSEELHAVTDPLGKRVEEKGDTLVAIVIFNLY